MLVGLSSKQSRKKCKWKQNEAAALRGRHWSADGDPGQSDTQHNRWPEEHPLYVSVQFWGWARENGDQIIVQHRENLSCQRQSHCKDRIILYYRENIFAPDSSFTFCHFWLKVVPQRLFVLVTLVHNMIMKILQCCGKIMIGGGGGVFNGILSFCKCKVEG